MINIVSVAGYRRRPKSSFREVNLQSLLKRDAGFVWLRGGVDPGLDLAHEFFSAPSGLAQANAVNSIDLDPDCADVPTIPTDVALHRICLGRLV